MAGAIATPALLSSIRSTPHLPDNIYYVLAGATLSTLNLAREIPPVLRFALEKGGKNSERAPDHIALMAIARRMREAIIKLAPIAGLPKAKSLLRPTPETVLTLSFSQSMPCKLSKPLHLPIYSTNL